MNIDKTEFKAIQNGDQIVAILTQMSTSQNPTEHSNDLMQALAQSASIDAYGLAFKHLVQMSAGSRSLDLIAFIADFKTLMLRMDISQMSTDVLRSYIIDLGAITSSRGFNLTAEDVPDWSDDLKTFFMLTMTKLHSLSFDTLAFLYNGAFGREFNVKCMVCSGDQTLYIDGEQTEGITPSNFENLPPMGYVPSDTPRLMYSAYRELDEKHLSMVMPYIYGSYNCSKCGCTNSVNISTMYWIMSNSYVFSASDEFLDKLLGIINKWDYNQANWADKLWFATKYYAAQCIALYGSNSLRAQKELVRSAVRVASLWGNDFPTQVAHSAIPLLDNSNESDELKADLHFWIGYALAYGWDLPREDYELAISHYRKAEELYTALYGEQNENVTKCRNNIAQTLADMPGGDMTPMIEQYEKLKSDPKATQAQIALAEHHLAEQYEERGEYAKAIEMEQSTLNEYIEEYGERSDMVADHKERIAELYDKMGDSDQALKILEESAEIHIREMGREYMLPPLFRNLIHKGKKLFNIAQEPSSFAIRVRSVSGVYQRLGDIYISLQDAKKALSRYQKSMELFTWVSVPTGIEMVTLHFKVGSALYCLGRDHEAISHLNEALKQLDCTINGSSFPEEVRQAQQFQEMVVSNIQALLSCDGVERPSEMEELYSKYGV